MKSNIERTFHNRIRRMIRKQDLGLSPIKASGLGTSALEPVQVYKNLKHPLIKPTGLTATDELFSLSNSPSSQLYAVWRYVA